MPEIKHSSQLKNWVAVNIIFMVGSVFAIGKYIQKVDNHIANGHIHMSFEKTQRLVLKEDYQKDLEVESENMREIKLDIKDIQKDIKKLLTIKK